jgi:hypothetical protein
LAVSRRKFYTGEKVNQFHFKVQELCQVNVGTYRFVGCVMQAQYLLAPARRHTGTANASVYRHA